MPPQNPQVANGNKALELVGALLILVIIGLGYYWYNHANNDSSVRLPTKSTSEIAVSGQFGKSTSAVSKVLPSKFPIDLPVETGNITENYRVFYNSTGLTQYTISYTSSKTQSALWSTYNSYFKAHSYVMNPKLTSETKGTLSGTLANTSLVVVLTKTSTGARVNITYIVQ